MTERIQVTPDEVRFITAAAGGEMEAEQLYPGLERVTIIAILEIFKQLKVVTDQKELDNLYRKFRSLLSIKYILHRDSSPTKRDEFYQQFHAALDAHTDLETEFSQIFFLYEATIKESSNISELYLEYQKARSMLAIHKDDSKLVTHYRNRIQQVKQQISNLHPRILAQFEKDLRDEQMAVQQQADAATYLHDQFVSTFLDKKETAE